MNKWLNSTVDTYIKHFGYSVHPTVYEVGSRDGHDGCEIERRIQDPAKPTIHSSSLVLFECNPPHIEAIKKDYIYPTLITDAISNKKGKTKFLQIQGNPDYMGSSSMDLDRVNYNWVKDTNTIEVNTRRLDSVIEELSHQYMDIDVMKIDIEGYTMEALEGLGKYLRNVRVFHLETEIEGRARKHTNLDIALFMEQKGYLCTVLEHEWGAEIQDQVWVRR